MGFRAYTHRLAQELRLLGWVRNLVDGKVESVARGEIAVLAEFESALLKGPIHGQVDALSVGTWMGSSKLLIFEVRKDGQKPCEE